MYQIYSFAPGCKSRDVNSLVAWSLKLATFSRSLRETNALGGLYTGRLTVVLSRFSSMIS